MQVIYTLFWTFLVAYLTTSTLAFFGVAFSTYGIYLLWYCILSLMSILLPERVGKIFNK